jgi:Family of unknown function (DUF6455)
MSSSSHAACVPAANVDSMMDRLGIDQGCRVAPRFGLTFCCALRTCGACTARDACTQWLAGGPALLPGPPPFCPNGDLLWELVCDPAVGRRTHTSL